MRRRIALSSVVALVAAICAAGASADASTTPKVTVLKLLATGGGPPAAETVGQVSDVRGEIRNPAMRQIGNWFWHCRYLGGTGTGTTTSHYCRFTVKLGSKGSITSEGGYGYQSTDRRWVAVTGGTGAFKGVVGSAKYWNLATPTTPITYYLIGA